MPKKSSRKRREPSGHEEGAQILEAATKAGTDYAHEQVGSNYFRDWVYDQMLEAEAMRKRDPSSVIPLETPADAKKVARNMLQQLEWDTKKQMDPREILEMAGAKGVFDSGSEDWVKDKYGITVQDVGGSFFEAFDETLRSTGVREWLTDLVLQTKEGMGSQWRLQTHVLHTDDGKQIPVRREEGHDRGWVLYTKDEWENDGLADWEQRPDGVVTFQGRATGSTLEVVEVGGGGVSRRGLGERSMTAEQIVKAAVDTAGEAGGIDEIRRIAAKGPGDMYFSEEDMAILVEAYGTPGDALYAIQLEAQNRVSGMTRRRR